jgi:hypothetical protein
MKGQLSFELGYLFGRLLPWILLVGLAFGVSECAIAMLE